MEGMTLQNPLYGKSGTLNGTILTQRLDGINRTGRGKPTALGEKGRECILIDLYEQYDYFIHVAF
jgi:hypothetical protein